MMRIPRTKRGLLAYVFAIFALTFSVFATSNTPVHKYALSPSMATVPTPNTQVLGESSETHTVTRVVDGDTFEIETGDKVRLIGVNAPESVDPRKPVQCFGLEAAEFSKKELLGKEVKLIKDVSETDVYDRLLRYVYVGSTFFNQELVLQGFATASTYPPDVKYSALFKEAQTEAFFNKRGLWSDKCLKK